MPAECVQRRPDVCSRGCAAISAIPYKVPLINLKFKELPLLQDTIVYAEDSDEEYCDAATRAAKQLEFEHRASLHAQAVLRGESLHIVSATLRGPFSSDWVNPFAAAKRLPSANRQVIARVATPERGPKYEPLTPGERVDSWLEKCVDPAEHKTVDARSQDDPASAVLSSSPCRGTPVDQLIVVSTQDVQAPLREVLQPTQDSINTIVADKTISPEVGGTHGRLQDVLADGSNQRKRKHSVSDDEGRAESAIKRIRTTAVDDRSHLEQEKPCSPARPNLAGPRVVPHSEEEQPLSPSTSRAAIMSLIRNLTTKPITSSPPAINQLKKKRRNVTKSRSRKSRSSQGTIKNTLRVKKTGQAPSAKPTPIFNEPDLDMTTSFEEGVSLDSASASLPKHKSPSAGPRSSAPRGTKSKTAEARRRLPLYMSSSQDPRIVDADNDFDVDGTVDEIGSFLSSWDEEKKSLRL